MKKETKTIIIGILITLLVLFLSIFILYLFYSKEENQEKENIETNNSSEIKTDLENEPIKEETKDEDKTTLKEEKENNTTNEETNDLKTENKVTIYLFHGSECPACNNAIASMKENLSKLANYEIKMLEVWHNEENQKILKKVEEKLNIQVTGIPFFVIGSYNKTGYDEEELLKTAEEMTTNKNYQDIINTIINENKDINPTIETLKKN